MNSYHWNILSIGIGVISFFIQVSHLVPTKNNSNVKWHKRISGRGWWIIVFSLLMCFCGVKTIATTQHEKDTADSIATARYDSVYAELKVDDTLLLKTRKDISDIKYALFRNNEVWDSSQRKIIVINNNNSENVTSNNQKGGQTGFNITNH